MSWEDSWRLGALPITRDPELLISADDVGGDAAWQELIRATLITEVFARSGVQSHTRITPEIKAQTIAALVPERTTVAGPAAAWIWGIGKTPEWIDVIYARGVHRPPPHLLRRCRQSQHLQSECTRIAGVLVTLPVRTALDIATHCSWEDASYLIDAMIDRGIVSLEEMARALDLKFRWQGRDHVRSLFTHLQER